jgi:hypothetical protein
MLSSLQDHVSKGTVWSNLPSEIQQSIGGSEQVYINTVKKYSLDRELKYELSPARTVSTKEQYYSDLIGYLKTRLKVSAPIVHSRCIHINLQPILSIC